MTEGWIDHVGGRRMTLCTIIKQWRPADYILITAGNLETSRTAFLTSWTSPCRQNNLGRWELFWKKLGKVGIILELYFGWFDGTILGPEGAEASSSRISSFFQLADHWTGYQWSQEMLVEEGRYLPFLDRAQFLIKFCCQRYLDMVVKKLFEQFHLEVEKSVLPSNIWTLL